MRNWPLTDFHSTKSAPRRLNAANAVDTWNALSRELDFDSQHKSQRRRRSVQRVNLLAKRIEYRSQHITRDKVAHCGCTASSVQGLCREAWEYSLERVRELSEKDVLGDGNRHSSAQHL